MAQNKKTSKQVAKSKKKENQQKMAQNKKTSKQMAKFEKKERQ